MENVNYSISTTSPQNPYLCKDWSSTIEENNNTKTHVTVNSNMNENQASIMFQSDREHHQQQSFETIPINSQANPNYQHQLPFYDSNYCYNQQPVAYQHQASFQYHNNTSSSYDNQKLSSPRNNSPVMYPQQPGRSSDSSSGSSTSDNRLIDSKQQQQQQQQQQRPNDMIITNVFSNDTDITSTVSGNNLLTQSEILDLDSHKVHQVFQGNNDSSNGEGANSKHNWSNYNFQNNDYNPNYIPNETFVKNVSTTVPVPSVSPTSSSNIRSIKKSTTKWRSNEPRRPKSYLCKACDKWFTSSGHLKRHYNTTLHKNAVTNSNEPDPASLPVSAHYHPERAQQHLQLQQQQAAVAQITDPNISPSNQVPNVKCIDNEDDYERSKSCATSVQLATLRPMIPIEPTSMYGGYQQQSQQQQQQQQAQSLPLVSTQARQSPSQQESQQQNQRQTQDHSPHQQQQSIVELLNAQNEVQHFQTLTSNSLNFPSNYPNELAPHVIQTTNTTNNNSIIQTAATAMNSSNINTTGTSNLQTTTTGDYILTTAPQTFQINATHFLVPQQQTLPSFEQLQNHRFGYVEFPNIKVEPSSPELDNVGGTDSVTNSHFESNNHLVQHQSTNQTIADNTFIIATDFASNKENIQLLIKASDTDLNTENYSLCYFDNTNQLYINVPDSSSSHTYQTSSNTATAATVAAATTTTTTTLMHSPPTSTIASPNNSSQTKAIDPIKRRKTNRPIIKKEVFDDSEGLISSTGSPSEVPMVSSNDGDSNNLEPDKPFCKICNKVFNKVCYYTQHNRSFHDGNKPYKCEKCGKKFKKEDLFNIHVTKHEGNKPHKCRLCPKQFNHKTDLSRHYYLHSGKKPYSCDRCGKGFIRRDHMLKHRETHTRRNQIIRCQQNMVKKTALIT